jgi:hypothetical protein
MVTQGGATVLDSDDQENNPFDMAITLELEATIEELEVRAKRELEELVTEFEEKKMALVEKSMALDELCDELEEKINMALDEELEAYVNPHVEFDGQLRSGRSITGNGRYLPAGGFIMISRLLGLRWGLQPEQGAQRQTPYRQASLAPLFRLGFGWAGVALLTGTQAP